MMEFMTGVKKKETKEITELLTGCAEGEVVKINGAVHVMHNVFREDVVTNGDGSADTLANAPLAKDQSFKVPKTIG